MATEHYERLSGLDNSFLLLESPTSHMHIALTAIFEPGSLATETGGVDSAAVRRLLASRLHLLPRYRQRLSRIPLVDEPIWIDDDCFDLGYHVRHTSLPRPGGQEQLRNHCARILERHLDRSRPLWEIWLVEGLDNGGFAMITKVHHCMVDGIGGVQLLASILGLEPDTAMAEPQPWQPRPAPAGARLVRRELVRRGGSALGLLGGLARSLAGPTASGATLRDRAAGMLRLARSGLADAAVEPFNATTGAHRRIDWTSTALDDAKRMKDATDASVNDVVLATVAGAVRRFLGDRAARARSFPVAVPVSVRASGTDASAGNRVSAWIVPLPIAECDPLRRLERVRATTADLKRAHQAEATHALTDIAEWTSTNALGLALRFVYRSRPYNMIITNVPGPSAPVYLLDAKMVAAYPHLPLFDGQSLGVALFSYAGTLSWGFGADWDAFPQLSRLREAVAVSFAELRDAIAAAAPAQAGKKRLIVSATQAGRSEPSTSTDTRITA